MDFVNESNFPGGWTVGFEPDGRELLVIAIKGTFTIPDDQREEPKRAEEQMPLVEADEFTGDPGSSAVLYETDYAHRKPYCDVLLNGSAYAPEGRPVSKVEVGLFVGPIKKTFTVTGHRSWIGERVAISASRPTKFTTMKISYDNAYGGVDNFHPDESKHRTYIYNPVGKGFHANLSTNLVHGTPMPTTEEGNSPVTMPYAKYRPMSFGPVGRNFADRYPFAGTYDQKWLDTKVPFWPDDFDYRYFQAAASDQWMHYPTEPYWVTLKNLNQKGLTRFQLPCMSMPVLLVPHRSKEKKVNAVLDTILIEPDNNRFMLTWRVSFPLRKNCFELRQVVAGEMPEKWYRDRKFKGKPYYANLAELANAKKQTG